MGAYEKLSRERREFLDDYLNNHEKPAWKCYQDAFDCEKNSAMSASSRLLNNDKIIQATAQLLGPARTRIVVKLSKMGDKVVRELRDLITMDNQEVVPVGDGEVLLNNRRIKLEAIQTFFDRIGIEGSNGDILIGINNAPDQSEKTVNVNLDDLDEEQREDFLKTSREVYIE